jgi:hypothetical protein
MRYGCIDSHCVQLLSFNSMSRQLLLCCCKVSIKCEVCCSEFHRIPFSRTVKDGFGGVSWLVGLVGELKGSLVV